MGYSTYFSGKFEVTPPLTEKTVPEICSSDWEEEQGLSWGMCDWEFSSNGSTIEHSGSEKSYSQELWLQAIIDTIAPLGHKINGKVIWQGENVGDCGVIWVKANIIRSKDIKKLIEKLKWKDFE